MCFIIEYNNIFNTYKQLKLLKRELLFQSSYSLTVLHCMQLYKREAKPPFCYLLCGVHIIIYYLCLYSVQTQDPETNRLVMNASPQRIQIISTDSTVSTPQRIQVYHVILVCSEIIIITCVILICFSQICSLTDPRTEVERVLKYCS